MPSNKPVWTPEVRRGTVCRALQIVPSPVTTPAGCTIDGIMELEERKLRVTLIKAVVRLRSAPGNWRSRNSAGVRRR